MTVPKSGFEPVAATVLRTFCEKLRTVPSDHFRGGVNGFFILHKSYLPPPTHLEKSTMPNSTRRRIGNRVSARSLGRPFEGDSDAAEPRDTLQQL